MAEALVLTVLNKIVQTGTAEAVQNLRALFGVGDEVDRLTADLRTIRAVLADAETRQLREEGIKTWLEELRAIFYDMDDVIDKWNSRMLLPQARINEHESSKLFSCNLLSCFSIPQKVGFRHELANQINQLKGRLRDTAARKDAFNFTTTAAQADWPQRAETISEIIFTEVKGRERETTDLKRMLLPDEQVAGDTPPPPKLRTISIVGLGGIGKTTLAQLVYNDTDVKTQFPVRIWVCVSEPFEEIRIARGILESLKGGSSSNIDGSNLQSIVMQIKQLLAQRAFLLVLDDVWNEDSTKWDQLRRVLIMAGQPKSRILVTTRKVNVATIMGSTESDVFRPGNLSDEECWEIFSEIAFSGRPDEERQRLEDLGREIAEKSKGLPLAAKTLGGLLRFRKSRQEWESVLRSELWQLEEADIERNLFAPLWLSCYDLSPTQRQCLLYCSLFPRDHIIEKEKLIRLWMGQSYLKRTDTKTMETLGEEYFQYLCARSFFQDFNRDNNGRVVTCKMHDIVHDFVRFLSKKECLSMEVTGGGAQHQREAPSSNQEARHASVGFAGRDPTFPPSIFTLNKLRSLLVSGVDTAITVDLDRLFSQLTCLRSLELSHCNIRRIPSTIGDLIHLRHLDLSWNPQLEDLPNTIGDLTNLMILILQGCSEHLKLPRMDKLNLKIFVYHIVG